MAVLVALLVTLLSMAGHSSAAYCLCKDGVSEQLLQRALDYACGAGADCTQVQQNGPCFQPNTLKSHCDYAVNSYYQRKSSSGATCDFQGAAILTNTPPSAAGSCAFPSSPGTSGTPTTPSTTPTTPSTTPTTPTTTTPTPTTPSTTPTPTTTTPTTTPTGGVPTTGGFPTTTTPTTSTTPSTTTGGTPSVFPGTTLGPTGSGINDQSSGVRLPIRTTTTTTAALSLAIWSTCLTMLMAA